MVPPLLRQGASLASVMLPCLVRNSIMPGTMSHKRKLAYAFLENLRVPMDMNRKLRRVMNNTLTKIRRVRGCCGDYGNPGC